MSLYLVKELLQAVNLQEQLLESEKLRKLAVEEERYRLARELHDSILQTLSTISTIAQTLLRVRQHHSEMARQGLNELAQLSQGALAEMRNLFLELRPNNFSAQSLGILLKQLSKAIQGRAKLQVNTTIKGDQPLPEDVKLVFYRISQEALNNTLKHAQATQISLTLQGNSEEIVLSVKDNGCGFDPKVIPPGHFGLKIMKERAELIGATFFLNSYSGKGTEIILRWAKNAKVSE